MGIDHRHVRKMLDYQLPFIGAAVPLKGFKETGDLCFNTGNELSRSENGLIEYDKVGTAVMMISRDLALKVVEKANKEEAKKLEKIRLEELKKVQEKLKKLEEEKASKEWNEVDEAVEKENAQKKSLMKQNPPK